MKITDVQATLLKTPYDGPFHPTWAPGQTHTHLYTTLVRIHTDAGITGIGAGPATGFEGVVGVYTFLRPSLIGQDPFATERIIKEVRSSSVRIGWTWMIEMALWDLIGKAAGLPVYKLWGGFADRLKAYASLGEMRSPEETVELAQRLYDEGFRALKVRFRDSDVRRDLRIVEAIRSAMGDRMDIMVDANQAEVMPGSGDYFVWDYFTALDVARALKDLGVLWLEEPLPRYDFDNIARLTENSPLPIAGGELNRGLHEYKLLIEHGCYHILQADASFSEGMLQLRKAAAIAEAFGRRFIPHTWSNGIGLRANLQVAASLPNAGWLEFPYDPPAWTVEARDRMLLDPLRIDPDGYVTVPQKPGLGFELDEDAVTKYQLPFDTSILTQ
ncbi:MAG TPA: mandelate racemase/muconate lactonizing enzyme family protein [Symbiobacteriaceae bacterium]